MEATPSRHVWVRMCITHCPNVTLQLNNFDLFRTCRTRSFCTVAWQLARFQLTRRIARSLGDSWASCIHKRLRLLFFLLPMDSIFDKIELWAKRVARSLYNSWVSHFTSNDSYTIHGRRQTKPDCSPPGYPPSRWLIIVICYLSVIGFVYVKRSTCASCRPPPFSKSHTNPILWIRLKFAPKRIGRRSNVPSGINKITPDRSHTP